MEPRTPEQILTAARAGGTKKNPFEASLAVSVATSKWGTRRKVNASDLSMTACDEEGESEEVSPEAVRVSKALIKSKSYDAIGHRDAAGRSMLNSIALPSNLRRSTYLVPVALLDKCEEILGDWMREREALIVAFLLEYAGAIADAREALGPLFDASQYPTRDTVRAAFDLQWHYETFDIPGKLEALRPELFEQERGKLAAKMQAASVQIQDALRVGLADMVGALAEKLRSERENGKPAVFRDSSVVKVQEFLASFDARNITGDDELEAIVAKAQSILVGREADDLRKDGALRRFVGEKLGEVSASLEVMVAPVRKVKVSKLDLD